MAENVSESLFQAIDTIVTKRLQAINFDNTSIYSITDASKADLGEYRVTDGSVTFTAYSKDTTYKENDAVYVTIPNNDFNEQKLIVGKYTAEDDKPFNFVNLFDTIIDVTGNIIDGQLPETGLTANAINNETVNGVEIAGANEEKILIWEKDCRNQNYIGFERLGIRGDFKSWLDSFDCVEGHYGLELVISCKGNDTYSNKTIYEIIRQKVLSGEEDDWNWVIGTSQLALDANSWIEPYKNNIIPGTPYVNAYLESRIYDSNGQYVGVDSIKLKENIIKQYIQNELNKTYTTEEITDIILDYINEQLLKNVQKYFLRLDSADMVGNPYNFISYFQQEQVFDVSELGQILDMKLYFYQEKNTFKDLFGQLIPHTDEFSDFLLPHNLFTIDPYITLGYDLDNFNGEQALIVCTDSTTYLYQDSIDSVTTEEDTYNDKYIHLSWIHKTDDGIVAITNADTAVDGSYTIKWYQYSIGASSPDEWAGADWKLVNNGQSFNYKLIIDENSYNKESEIIKAIIIYTDAAGHTTAIRSNTLTFRNESTVLSDAEIDQNRGLTLRCLDGTEGNYYIYRQDYSLIDQADANELRSIQCEFYSQEFGLEGLLTEAKTIIWHIPATNTMLRVAGSGGTLGLKDFNYSYVNSYFSANSIDLPSNDWIGKEKALYYYSDKLYNSTSQLPAAPQTATNYYAPGDTTKTQYSCKTSGYLYDPDNKEIVIIWYGDENNAYTINPYFQYTINNMYSQNATNNKIVCEVNKNNRDYIGGQEFSFGTAGTNGTAYTLVIDMYEVGWENGQNILLAKDTAVTAGADQKVFVANLYDTKGQLIDIYNNENFENLKFTWYLGYEKSTQSFYNENTNLGINYFNGDYTAIESNEDWNFKVARNSIGSPDGFTYWNVVNPNYLLLTVNNINLDNLLYLVLKLDGWGDYTLTTVYPIPIRKDTYVSDNAYTKYLHITGPDRICYPPDGYPEFYNNPYQLYAGEFDSSNNLITKDIQLNNVTWGTEVVENDKLQYYEVYHPFLTLPNNPTAEQTANYNKVLRYYATISEKKVLQPLDFYVEGQQPYGVQAYINGEVVWTQPIWTYQNDYFSQTLNEWNGKGIQIDEDNGTIVTRGIAAGKKENDNSFTGVVIGDWSTAGGGNSSDVSTANTGVYGFEHGAMAYAFKDDGTAFIGKSGKGRILFDGNESTITSENFNSLGMGLEMDLDDGVLQFKNKEHNALSGINDSEATIIDYFITLDASNDNLNADDKALQIGSSNTPNFYVLWDGTIYAKNGYFEGHITGGDINIGSGAFQVSSAGAVSAGYGTLTIDTKGNLNVNGNSFSVSSNGGTSISAATIDDATIMAGTYYNADIQIINGTLEGTLDATNGIIQNPEIILYVSGSVNKKTKLRVKKYSWGGADKYYYYTQNGKDYAQGTLPNEDAFSALNTGNRRLFYWTIEETIIPEVSDDSDGTNKIKFYSGTGPSNAGKYLGYLGYAGTSNTGGTIGIDLSPSPSDKNYGITFKSSWESSIAITENFRVQLENGDYIQLWNSRTKGPTLYYNGTSYDLRYAYFA